MITPDVGFATQHPRADVHPYSVATPLGQSQSPSRRGATRWVIGILVGLLVLAGIAVAVAIPQSKHSKPTARPGNTQSSALPPAPAQTPPQSPGIEPPKAGGWPAQWAKFSERDGVRTYPAIQSLGMTIKVPMNWRCIEAQRMAGYTRWACGVTPGEPGLGGDIIVRDCASPCDSNQQARMRQNEDAWGVQWVKGGSSSTFAECYKVPADNGTSLNYGMVVVGFWRNDAEGELNREIVVRMTSPQDGANQIRRVVGYLRDSLLL